MPFQFFAVVHHFSIYTGGIEGYFVESRSDSEEGDAQSESESILWFAHPKDVYSLVHYIAQKHKDGSATVEPILGNDDIGAPKTFHVSNDLDVNIFLAINKKLVTQTMHLFIFELNLFHQRVYFVIL